MLEILAKPSGIILIFSPALGIKLSVRANNCCNASSPTLHRLPYERKRMKSYIAKRSIVIAGHRTSVSIEEQFWSALKVIARGQRMSLKTIILNIKIGRQGNLSSSIRLYVLDQLNAQVRGFTGDHIDATIVSRENGQHHA
jgi:predicted DNA-binding ribbon-helix-helix protein